MATCRSTAVISLPHRRAPSVLRSVVSFSLSGLPNVQLALSSSLGHLQE
jgi:hypothetical protein